MYCRGHVKAKEQIMEVKLSATKFPALKKFQAKLPALKKFQAKHGLIAYKSDFWTKEMDYRTWETKSKHPVLYETTLSRKINIIIYESIVNFNLTFCLHLLDVIGRFQGVKNWSQFPHVAQIWNSY